MKFNIHGYTGILCSFFSATMSTFLLEIYLFPLAQFQKQLMSSSSNLQRPSDTGHFPCPTLPSLNMHPCESPLRSVGAKDNKDNNLIITLI